MFLVGILPALLVYWIRKNVPEPAEWQRARAAAGQARVPGLRALFEPALRGLTVRAILVCSLSLTAWWAFLFWHPQHLRNLPELASWPRADRERLVSLTFFAVNAASIAGNFFAGFLAKALGYKRAIAVMFVIGFLGMTGGFGLAHGHRALVAFWLPTVGFAAGVFGLFTMYLPPLFPTLLRTTGAGFSYNIGRLAAALGTVLFGLLAPVGDFNHALLADGILFLLAAALALTLPELREA